MDWRTIKINDTNETFLISIVNEPNDEFLFNLTNLREIWREKINWQEILDRVKSDNPFMNVVSDESSIERTICSLASCYQYSSKNDCDLLLKSKYYVGGLPFHIHWKLQKGTADLFYEEITRKLLVTLLNVQDQRKELIEIVKRKDAEINQFHIEGATLSRKQIATQPFLKSEFERKFELNIDSTLFVDGNCNTIKDICNYSDLISVNSTSTSMSNMTEGPSPSKILKPHKKKEENAMRKFKAKKDCKIQYESSCELLVSDEDIEPDTNLKSSFEIQPKGFTNSSTDQREEEVPKRKFKSKLNL